MRRAIGCLLLCGCVDSADAVHRLLVASCRHSDRCDTEFSMPTEECVEAIEESEAILAECLAPCEVRTAAHQRCLWTLSTTGCDADITEICDFDAQFDCPAGSVVEQLEECLSLI